MPAAFSVKADNALTILKDIIVEVATLSRPVTAAAVAGLILALVPGAGLHAESFAAGLAAIGTADMAVAKLVGMQPPATMTTRVKVDALLTAIKDIILDLATLRSPVTAAAVAGTIVTLVPGAHIDTQWLASILVAVGAVDAALERILPVLQSHGSVAP